MIFKLAAEGLLIYFTTVWNLFDFAIVICSLPIFPIEDDSIVVLRMPLGRTPNPQLDVRS